jgi:hypothetical protein
MTTDTPTVGADGSLRLVFHGRRLVLGPHQVRLLHALWQTAAGWLPRASLPAVMAGVAFTPHRPPQLPSQVRTSVEASLRRLRTQGLIAPTYQGRVALTALGDSLVRSLVAWVGWSDYWASLAEISPSQRDGSDESGSMTDTELLWTWADARVELLALLDRLTPEQAHDIVRHLLATEDQDLLAAVLVGRVRRRIARNDAEATPDS